MTPTPSQMPDVVLYLLGEGELDGCRYPDFPDNGEKYKRRYWWRKALREAWETRAASMPIDKERDEYKQKCSYLRDCYRNMRAPTLETVEFFKSFPITSAHEPHLAKSERYSQSEVIAKLKNKLEKIADISKEEFEKMGEEAFFKTVMVAREGIGEYIMLLNALTQLDSADERH